MPNPQAKPDRGIALPGDAGRLIPDPASAPQTQADIGGKPDATVRKAMDFAAVRDWPGYFETVRGKPPRDTLLRALDLFESEGFPPGRAADLGCGEGRDTAELLRRGWSVIAIDADPSARDHLFARLGPNPPASLTFTLSQLEMADWGVVDLVNAAYSLPFLSPRSFNTVWARIVSSLRPGGRLAGQLFGDRDSWATLPDRAHHTQAQVESLLAPFDTELFQVEEREDAYATGQPKHWHIIHIVARKR